MKIALITGASSGLGEEFIRQIQDPRISQIWAVARRKDRLEALSSVTDIPVRAIPMDLTVPDNITLLSEMLQESGASVLLLINAAGFGKIGSFREISREESARMIDLNCRAAVGITEAAIPFMEKGARILQICSTAAFQPFQFLNVYAASKAFLYRYSRALRYELKGTGIGVTAVCPYWIKDTEFIPVARDTSVQNRRIRHFLFASRKHSVVRLSLLAAKLNVPVCTPGIVCTLHRIAAKFVPSVLMNAIWAGLRRI